MVDTYYPTAYWLTQSAHILMLSSYWFSLIKLSLLHMSRLRSQKMLVGNIIFVSLSKTWTKTFSKYCEHLLTALTHPRCPRSIMLLCVQVGEHRGGRVPDCGQQHGGRPLGHGQGQHQDELREAQPGDKVSWHHSVCLSIDDNVWIP